MAVVSGCMGVVSDYMGVVSTQTVCKWEISARRGTVHCCIVNGRGRWAWEMVGSHDEHVWEVLLDCVYHVSGWVYDLLLWSPAWRRPSAAWCRCKGCPPTPWAGWSCSVCSTCTQRHQTLKHVVIFSDEICIGREYFIIFLQKCCFSHDRDSLSQSGKWCPDWSETVQK